MKASAFANCPHTLAVNRGFVHFSVPPSRHAQLRKLQQIRSPTCLFHLTQKQHPSLQNSATSLSLKHNPPYPISLYRFQTLDALPNILPWLLTLRPIPHALSMLV